ncbi:RNA-binding domain-containing protein [Peptostreptococcus porci]|uniref:RNA-binding domain-containing protein n=1 Tax=Peptostreptococcus porci TaxID=2652282 RepID=UPI002A82CC9B|nr:RNA-binding domain-containing protein [Peptostreptococcus porci]MDY4129287.1 putative DNA binding domain-containing protein [Peptostreptococcus porci]
MEKKYTDTIAKEIVSFLNSDGGTILIGVKDNGIVIGVDKIDEVLRKISDIITSQIEPNPQDEISCELKFDEGKTLIVLHINKGHNHIYCQKKYGFSSTGCTIRIGTTCKEMTPEQIKIRYEKKFIDNEYMLKKRANSSNLSFRELKIYYSEKNYHLEDKSFETNLNLRNEAGEYNLLAELLSDKNNIPFIFVKFQGENKASISERSDYGYGCILTTYEKIKNRLQAENICISDTTVRPRKDTYLFDYDCVNEAILNALVHNDWTITEPQISMFYDRLEILSHGGLPSGMTKEQFFDGISKPRNATLMRIFLNMGLTEHTGHGIPTIVEKYGKDVFQIESNHIRCTIPFEKEVIDQTDNKNVGLNKTEKKVVEFLIENPSITSVELAEKIGVTKRTIERTFKSLQEKEIIERIGSKRDGNWIVVR